MIYVVSGFMRSGTSMMMEALEAGGMKTAYSKRRDKTMNKRLGSEGYVPNESYRELSPEDYRSPLFPKKFNNKLVKCMLSGALLLPNAEYRIVVMRRETRDIARSCIAVWGRTPAPVSRPDFQEMLDRQVNALRDRKSCLSLDEYWYNDVLENPLAVFESLGWPINPVLAAKIPNLQFNRMSGLREELLHPSPTSTETAQELLSKALGPSIT